MNKEQNIDDILKLLKSSYEDEGSDTGEEVTENDSAEASEISISQDELKEKLKEQFMGDGLEARSSSIDYESDAFSYAIDDEFLVDATNAVSENVVELTVSDTFNEDAHQEALETPQKISEEALDEKNVDSEIDTAVLSEDILTEKLEESILEDHLKLDSNEGDDLPPFDLVDKSTEIEDDLSFDDEIDLFEDDSIEDGLFIENDEGDIILLKQGDDTKPLTDEEEAELAFMLEEDISDEYDEISEDLEDIEENESDYDIPYEEDQKLEEETDMSEVGKIEIDEAEAYEKELFSDDSGQLTLFESNDNTSEDMIDAEEAQDELDENQMIMDFGDFEGEFIDPYALEDGENYTHVDDSVLNLMIEFGDFSALKDKSVRDQMEEYLSNTNNIRPDDIDPSESFAFDGGEFENEKQIDEIGDVYRKEKLFTLLRVIGCGIFALLTVLYELIAGGVGIKLSFVARETVFYPLIAIQLVVFAAIFAWRELWIGIKKAFTFKSDLWSIISIVLIFTIIHGIVISSINAEKSYTFGTIAVFYILIGLFTELFKVLREAKCFEVYSSNETKYTFVTEAVVNSSSDKMYRGGLPYSKKVFEFSNVDFPKGYFSAINSRKTEDKFINYSITPMVVISAIALILSALLNNSLTIALSSFMITLCILSPLSAVLAHIFPLIFASNRLYSKGCAISSEDTVRNYAKCDYIIFKDMHLFKPCLAKDNGIVIYDERNSRKIIEYLDTLYSAIGGPMKDVFGGISKGKYDLKMRRIARNGIEALIDSRHNIMLGDVDFLKRYGINLSLDDAAKNHRGILGFVLDGRLVAKLSIKYNIESKFEVLAEKLGAEGIRCTIETYDPVINSAFVAYCRNNSDNPVNVVHKNVYDYYGNIEIKSERNTGAVACASRLKLVELEIWCKRISKILRVSSILQVIISCVAISLVALAIIFGLIKSINQYYVLLWQLISLLPLSILMLAKLPKRKYFNI